MPYNTVCGNSSAVCGWSELLDANVIGAAFTMYDHAFIGMAVFLLFIVYQFMLWAKTQNLTLCWVTGIFFVALFLTSQVIGTVIRPLATQMIFVILAFELAGIFFLWIWK